MNKFITTSLVLIGTAMAYDNCDGYAEVNNAQNNGAANSYGAHRKDHETYGNPSYDDVSFNRAAPNNDATSYFEQTGVGARYGASNYDNNGPAIKGAVSYGMQREDGAPSYDNVPYNNAASNNGPARYGVPIRDGAKYGASRYDNNGPAIKGAVSYGMQREDGAPSYDYVPYNNVAPNNGPARYGVPIRDGAKYGASGCNNYNVPSNNGVAIDLSKYDPKIIDTIRSFIAFCLSLPTSRYATYLTSNDALPVSNLGQGFATRSAYGPHTHSPPAPTACSTGSVDLAALKCTTGSHGMYR